MRNRRVLYGVRGGEMWYGVRGGCDVRVRGVWCGVRNECDVIEGVRKIWREGEVWLCGSCVSQQSI